MNKRFLTAIVIVTVTVGVLVYSASKATAKSVVTVDELISAGGPRARVQLGARVSADQQIVFETEPKRIVKFSVMDIVKKSELIEVVYEGSMPDTLRGGRDVILQGDYDGTRFIAKSLLTQCPSKYKPPVPGEQPLKTS